MNGFTLDLIVAAFIIFSVIYCAKKGLLKSVFSFVSYFVAFSISALVRPYVTELLENAQIISEKTDSSYLLYINIISYVVVSVVIISIFFAVERILDLIAILPVIGSLNTFGGFLFGLLFASVVCSFVFSMIPIAGEWTNVEKIVKIIDESTISMFFYKNSLFLLLQ